MSTASISTRSARKAVQGSRIPEPRGDPPSKASQGDRVPDLASPDLGRSAKRRHVSEPAPSEKQSPKSKRSKTASELIESPRRSSRLSKTPLGSSDRKNCGSNEGRETEPLPRSKRHRSSPEVTSTRNKRQHSTRDERSVVSPSSKENKLTNKSPKISASDRLSNNETLSFNSTFTVESSEPISSSCTATLPVTMVTVSPQEVDPPARGNKSVNVCNKSPVGNKSTTVTDGETSFLDETYSKESNDLRSASKAEHKTPSAKRSPRKQDLASKTTPDKVSSSKVKVNTPPTIAEEDSLDIPLDVPRRRNSGSGRKKSKRRSSFVRGRISKVFPVLSDVSLEIPAELPAEDRLTELTTATVRYTLNKLQDEFPELDGFQQFEVEVCEAVNATKEKLRSDGFFRVATCKERILPNPTNELMSRTIEERISYTQRLKTELERWKELLKTREDEAAKAERALQEIGDNSITEQPATGFLPQELCFLAKKPNYSKMLDTLYTHREGTVLSIKELVKVVSTLQHSQERASSILNEHTQWIYRETFGDIPSFDKPHELVASVLEYKD